MEDNWINVNERFPDIDQRVLVYQKGGVYAGNEIDIEYRMCLDFWCDQGIRSEITHWMPLPKPPKE